MKIKTVSIAAFGGLKNYTLSLEPGLTVLYGDNENGKTTLMAFIKMMFYGTERGSAAIAKNPRKKYAPWDGSAMAGSVEFEHGGKRYRLEREFRSSNSTDKITLCDLDLGTRQTASGDVGSTFFGLSAAAFERSVFIGQFGHADPDAASEGEINAKLSNIVTTGDETTSYETVRARLEKARLSLISKRGRAGEYDKNKEALLSLRDRLTRAEDSAERCRLLAEQSNRTQNEILLLQGKVDRQKAALEREQDVRNAQKLRELLHLKAELDRMNDALRLSDGKVVDETFVRMVRFCLSKLDATEQKLALKTEEAETLRKTIELAEHPSEDVSPEKEMRLRAEVEKAGQKKAELAAAVTAAEQTHRTLLSRKTEAEGRRKPVQPVLLAAALIVLAAAFPLFGVSPLWGGVSLAAAAVLLSLSFILRPRDVRQIEEYRRQLEQAGSALNEARERESAAAQALMLLNTRLEAVSAALGSSAAVLERQKALLHECREAIAAMHGEAQIREQELLTLYRRCRPAENAEEVRRQLDSLAEKAAGQKELKQRLNYMLKDLGGISYEQAAQRLAETEGADTQTVDFEELKRQYELLLSEISDKKAALASLLTESRTVAKTAENPEVLKKAIRSLEEKTAEQKEFADAAELAGQALEESFAELRRSYGSVLEKQAGELFAGLTDGRYHSMSISKSFDIHVEKTGVFGGKELDYLSSGTADQAYLSLRLALAELISESGGEPLPVLLDDALTQYDDTRMRTALSFLKAHAENGQMILFTCHGAVQKEAEALSIHCKKL